MASFSSDDNSSSSPTDQELLGLFSGLKRKRLNDQGRESLLFIWNLLESRNLQGGRNEAVPVGSTFLFSDVKVYAIYTGLSKNGFSVRFDLMSAADDTKIGDGSLDFFFKHSSSKAPFVSLIDPEGRNSWVSYEIIEIAPPYTDLEEEEDKEEEPNKSQEMTLALALLGKCMEGGTYPSKITVRGNTVTIDY